MSIFTQRRTAKLLRMAFLLLFVADPLPAATVGAAVAWTTYQAEQGVTTGEKLFSRSYGDIANEAVDHACVASRKPGTSASSGHWFGPMDSRPR